jgi:hypothetical protein
VVHAHPFQPFDRGLVLLLSCLLLVAVAKPSEETAGELLLDLLGSVFLGLVLVEAPDLGFGGNPAALDVAAPERLLRVDENVDLVVRH